MVVGKITIKPQKTLWKVDFYMKNTQKNKKLLWEVLGLAENFGCLQVDDAYKKCKKNKQTYLAWKVLRDPFYADVYKKTKSVEKCIDAGFILDSISLENIDYYKLDLLTTPVCKILDNIKQKTNPVVLLSTGGFYPIHDGHIEMFELAKNVLQKNGYDVVGGYFSPSHDHYVKNKPNFKISTPNRIELCWQKIENSNWLMIDPWESLYAPTYINFTDVITRLELYLKKHVNKNIKVAYVFGGDNVGFVDCFENRGIAVCIERNTKNNLFFEKMAQNSNKNVFFVENKSQNANFSSRNMRDNSLKKQTIDTTQSNVYLVRNEKTRSIEFVCEDEKTKQKCHKMFLKKFVKNIKKALPKQLQVKTIELDFQLDIAKQNIQNKKTISIDPYFDGTHNLKISRMFDFADRQKKYNALVERVGEKPLDEQISNIKKGEYTLVDDDSVSGATLKGILEKFPQDIKIKDIYLLSSCITQKPFDVVDLRDFIVGAKNGGLCVRLPNGQNARAPYLLPYVCLKTRANIICDKELEFSLKMWKLNKEFYKNIKKTVKLSQCDAGFVNLMKFVGFSEDTNMIEICDWHIKHLC